MAGTTRIDLLSNAAAGNGAAFNLNVGGWYALIAEATWGGGSVKLQVQSPQGTWIDVTSSSQSANGMVLLQLPPGQYRGVVTTSTAAYASLVTVPTITTR